MKMKSLCCVLVLFLWVVATCQPSQESRGDKDRAVFREYCLMNATETYDFELPGSLTVEDLEGHSIRLDSLAKEGKLVLRIRGNFCEDCVEAEVRQMDSLEDRSRVVVIATYDNLRMLKMVVEKLGIEVPVYYLPNGIGQELFSRNDSKGIPYLFVLRNNLRCESVFFPSKLFPRFSADYYRLVVGGLHADAEAPVMFRRPDVNLGRVETGKIYEVEFAYTNPQDKPLVIQDVRHSCDCVVPEWDDKPLRRNEAAVLKVRFAPKGHGYSMQSIMVYHNQSRYPVRLTVRAEVTSEDSSL